MYTIAKQQVAFLHIQQHAQEESQKHQENRMNKRKEIEAVAKEIIAKEKAELGKYNLLMQHGHDANTYQMLQRREILPRKNQKKKRRNESLLTRELKKLKAAEKSNILDS